MNETKIPEKLKLPSLKRIFDIKISVLLFLISIPFLLILLIWIFIEQLFIRSSRGSIFYSELRVSQGQEFKFYKFRIFKQKVLDKVMKDTGFIHTKPLEQDPKNMTGYGRFLKRVYMDEFPQLFNVLKGDMTLVGPRPTNVFNSTKMREAGDYSKEIMKCGLTGLVQINKGKMKHEVKNMDMLYIDYIKNNSGWKIVFYDLKILYYTVVAVFQAKGL